MTTTPNDFATWEAGLEEVFADALGLEANAVAWLGKPRPQIRGVRAQLEPSSIIHRGVDERRYRTADGVEELVGQRAMVLQIRVWSHRNSLAASPRVYVERLRTRLRWSTTVAALLAFDLAFERASEPVHLPATFDGRTIDQAMIDLWLGYTWIEADEATPAGFITRVLARSEWFRRSNGAALPGASQIELDVGAGPELSADFSALELDALAAAAANPAPEFSTDFSTDFGGGI